MAEQTQSANATVVLKNPSNNEETLWWSTQCKAVMPPAKITTPFNESTVELPKVD
jgi:hypothetical protein